MAGGDDSIEREQLMEGAGERSSPRSTSPAHWEPPKVGCPRVLMLPVLTLQRSTLNPEWLCDSLRSPGHTLSPRTQHLPVSPCCVPSTCPVQEGE